MARLILNKSISRVFEVYCMIFTINCNQYSFSDIVEQTIKNGLTWVLTINAPEVKRYEVTKYFSKDASYLNRFTSVIFRRYSKSFGKCKYHLIFNMDNSLVDIHYDYKIESMVINSTDENLMILKLMISDIVESYE